MHPRCPHSVLSFEWSNLRWGTHGPMRFVGACCLKGRCHCQYCPHFSALLSAGFGAVGRWEAGDLVFVKNEEQVHELFLQTMRFQCRSNPTQRNQASLLDSGCLGLVVSKVVPNAGKNPRISWTL